MNYSVSNIAWLPIQDKAVAKFLKNSVVTGIELAPSRYFKDVANTSENEFINLREHWENLGFSITSLQSLLFNRPDLKLFGSEQTREMLSNFLLKLGTNADFLGAGPLVFGSPRNRNRIGHTHKEAERIAREFFENLDSKWGMRKCFIAMEANPETYECNFITKSSQASKFVETLNLGSFRWHLDLACTELGGESSVAQILESRVLPAHIHLSESNLHPLVDKKIPFYKDFLNALKSRNYQGVVTLEMRQKDELKDLFKSIEILDRIYT